MPEADTPFMVDLKTNTLHVAGAEVRVPPYAAEIADALIECHPNPVPRETLGYVLYGRAARPVEWEMGIRVRLTKLRKALRNYGLDIECVRKRGYRVVSL
jgi:DNA-binding winged helix-turn-helix (wHTH) protein